jgi:Na+-transporting NADH:ubiquinone oxidoreductase subunit A
MVRFVALLLVFFTGTTVFGQAQAAENTTWSSMFVVGILVLLLVLAFALAMIVDRMMKMTAGHVAPGSEDKFSIFPTQDEMVGVSRQGYVESDKMHVLTKGHDILLQGEPVKPTVEVVRPSVVAIKPTDIRGIFPIPQMLVQVGDSVKAGDLIFQDKRHQGMKFASPVSGEIIDIVRGEKRAITAVHILVDGETKYREFNAPKLDAPREELIDFMVHGGVWPFVRQRPYNVIADPAVKPVNIFVSTFDTAPLAPDSNVCIAGQEVAFQKGLDVLAKLTEGKVCLGLDARADHAPVDAFAKAQNVERHWFKGAHPCGNVGIQAHHIAPLNKGEVIWTIQYQDVVTIGSLFSNGKYNAERVVALVGAELENPMYIRTFQGARVTDLVKLAGKKEGNIRLISGDVLTGRTTSESDFLDFYDNQLTAVQEGDYYEIFGWMLPLAPRPSVSPTFPTYLLKDFKFRADTNTHGEERAFVVTGQYEEVLPMDIYPQYLFKAIITNDYDRMEGLGIYELDEEDVALCEFVCTSKQPLQQILRKGLTMVQEEG